MTIIIICEIFQLSKLSYNLVYKNGIFDSLTWINLKVFLKHYPLLQKMLPMLNENWYVQIRLSIKNNSYIQILSTK